MNEAHWHLIINHFPIIFPIVGIIIMITGIISKSKAVKRTALIIFILGSITTVLAMTSGERAEEVVENINGVTENYIENHEEKAELFALLSYILGGLSSLGLWTSYKKKVYDSIFLIITLIFAFLVVFFAKQTATSGGEIRHTEIRIQDNTPMKIGNCNEP